MIVLFYLLYVFVGGYKFSFLWFLIAICMQIIVSMIYLYRKQQAEIERLEEENDINYWKGK